MRLICTYPDSSKTNRPSPLALEDDLTLEGYQVEVVGDGETAARPHAGRRST